MSASPLFAPGAPRRRLSVRTAIASSVARIGAPCLRPAKSRGVSARASQRKENPMAFKYPPLTPERRRLHALFVEKFTVKDQVEIRARCEKRGFDYLTVLEKNGDLRPLNPTAPKKGKNR